MTKKLISYALLSLVLIFLTSCSMNQVSSDNRFLPYPGTDWTMTPDELCNALSLNGGDYTTYPPEDENDVYIIVQSEANVFGVTADIKFWFSDENTDSEYHLFRIQAAFPDATDFDSLKSALTDQYGEPEIGKYLEWHSAETRYEIMPEEDRERLSEMGLFDQQYFTETPVSTVRLIINGIPDATFQGNLTGNKLDLFSSLAYHTLEGGLPD